MACDGINMTRISQSISFNINDVTSKMAVHWARICKGKKKCVYTYIYIYIKVDGKVVSSQAVDDV